MDELNYRRLTSREKTRCEGCGATAYQDPREVYRCVVCDHELFELCLDCGHLVGWCECPPAGEPPAPSRAGAGETGK
ncbi:MAG: hypothetical protein ACE5JG_10565 [Planctomycetota bacterium]